MRVIKLESQSESIRILTVHKSKSWNPSFSSGLSFPSVGSRDDFKYHRMTESCWSI